MQYLALAIKPLYDKSDPKVLLSGIYIIRNKIDSRVYIGSAKRFKKRFKEHTSGLLYNKHHSIKLQNFVNKYGIENLYFEILEIVDYSDQLEALEVSYIQKFDSYHKRFNCQLTAARRLKEQVFSEERLKQMSESMTGEKNHMFGKTHSKEARAAISLSHKGKQRTPTPEALENLRAAIKRRVASASNKEHARALGKRIRTAEEKEKLSQALKSKSTPILQYSIEGQFLKEWKGRWEINNFYGGSLAGDVSKSFKKKAGKAAPGGFQWLKKGDFIKTSISPYQPKTLNRPVLEFSLDGELIKIWCAASDAIKYVQEHGFRYSKYTFTNYSSKNQPINGSVYKSIIPLDLKEIVIKECPVCNHNFKTA